jgi:hypothetical protein
MDHKSKQITFFLRVFTKFVLSAVAGSTFELIKNTKAIWKTN